jgi:Na+/proline symporter/nitrogen-specific signal transduction histidine kinase
VLPSWLILGSGFGYLCLLFAIAYWGDKRADAGRSVVASPYVYALSIAVYCTAWTFYGSVGRAATSGIDFLPIYLGPTLVAVLWWPVMRKILRISKSNRITSIADFVASRYGKSQLLGGLVTVIAVVVITPYIALQLKGVWASYHVLQHYPAVIGPDDDKPASIFSDTAFYVAALMAAFAILYGTRDIDATERHDGMVAAIAFESIIKLVAFLAVGVFVTYGMFNGLGDIFTQAAARPDIAPLLTTIGAGGDAGWLTMMLLSMAAILFLPRQFQVLVVENVNERHLDKAVWLFPLYLLLINVFVLPLAFAGLLRFDAGAVDPDTFVLTLPMLAQSPGIALLTFIGGLSAATGMVIVETIALSTMICNDLVMPILLRTPGLRLTERGDLTRLLIAIRRGSIVLILFLGYLYFRFIGSSYALVTIGLLSFAAVAQFAPAIIGGMYWRGGTLAGALTGLTLGFIAWVYTLLLPSFAKSGWISEAFLEDGPWGIGLLNPYQLFGLAGFDPLSHSLFWSMAINIGGYVVASLATRQSPTERIQVTRFVEALEQTAEADRRHLRRGEASYRDLHGLVARFIGRRRADRAFAGHAAERGLNLAKLAAADAPLLHFTERLLAGAIGAASARVMVASVVKGENLGPDEVMAILDEASQVIGYSRQLEQKSLALEAASAELRAANERLKELDQLKDEFIATVTHELRTPLTSIRSFCEILHDDRDIPVEQRNEFLAIITKESERLTRLINQVLDLAKIEAGRFDWQIRPVEVGAIVADAAAAVSRLFSDKEVGLIVDLPPYLPLVQADRDQLMQVVINLLSNAVKFCASGAGRVVISGRAGGGGVEIRVADNGPGIAREHIETIFERFRQVGASANSKPPGSGLGLPISRRIIEHFGGRIWAESKRGQGATFIFTLPATVTAAAMEAAK